MKTGYDKLANCAGYHESDRVCLYHPICMKGKSPKLQCSWEGPYKIVTWINDVVYRIQKNPRSRMIVVHLDLLAPYQGAAQDEQWMSGWRMVTATRKKKKPTRGNIEPEKKKTLQAQPSEEKEQ
jgi:hypothetical protein